MHSRHSIEAHTGHTTGAAETFCRKFNPISVLTHFLFILVFLSYFFFFALPFFGNDLWYFKLYALLLVANVADVVVMQLIFE